VPSLLSAFLEEPELARCAALRRVAVGGDAVSAELMQRFHKRVGGLGVELQILYGPTEAAVDATWHACDPGEEQVSIGRPQDGVAIRLLDRERRLVPLG